MFIVVCSYECFLDFVFLIHVAIFFCMGIMIHYLSSWAILFDYPTIIEWFYFIIWCWIILFYHLVLNDFILSFNLEWFYFIIALAWSVQFRDHVGQVRRQTFLWRLWGMCPTKGLFPFLTLRWALSLRMTYSGLQHIIYGVASYQESVCQMQLCFPCFESFQVNRVPYSTSENTITQSIKSYYIT